MGWARGLRLPGLVGARPGPQGANRPLDREHGQCPHHVDAARHHAGRGRHDGVTVQPRVWREQRPGETVVAEEDETSEAIHAAAHPGRVRAAEAAQAEAEAESEAAAQAADAGEPAAVAVAEPSDEAASESEGEGAVS